MKNAYLSNTIMPCQVDLCRWLPEAVRFLVNSIKAVRYVQVRLFLASHIMWRANIGVETLVILFSVID